MTSDVTWPFSIIGIIKEVTAASGLKSLRIGSDGIALLLAPDIFPSSSSVSFGFPLKCIFFFIGGFEFRLPLLLKDNSVGNHRDIYGELRLIILHWPDPRSIMPLHPGCNQLFLWSNTLALRGRIAHNIDYMAFCVEWADLQLLFRYFNLTHIGQFWAKEWRIPVEPREPWLSLTLGYARLMLRFHKSSF